MFGLAVTALALLLAACKVPGYPAYDGASLSDYGEITVDAVDAVLDADFMRGFDASMVYSLEQRGVVFYDEDNTERDIFAILKDHGVNWIRLRLWVDPGTYSKSCSPNQYPQGMNNLAVTKALAKRAKAHGLKFLLDLHYSDTWAHPGQQIVPAKWSGTTGADAMAEQVASYTKSVVTELVSAGCRPDMVQVGNEVTSGMLCGTTTDTTNLNAYLKAGCAAVKEVDSEILVMLHIERPGQYGASWFGTYAADCDYDVAGLSWYPFHDSHGTIENLGTVIEEIAALGKKVVIAETSYGWSTGYSDWSNNEFWEDDEEAAVSQLKLGDGTYPAGITSALRSDDGTEYVPATIQNQANIIRAIIQTTANAGGCGVFYWGGDWIPVSDTDSAPHGSSWENQAMFGYDGKVLPSLDAFNVKGK